MILEPPPPDGTRAGARQSLTEAPQSPARRSGTCRLSSDELLGLKPAPRVEAPRQPPEEKRLWRHLRIVAQLPERDQRAVLRLIDSAARATKAG